MYLISAVHCYDVTWFGINCFVFVFLCVCRQVKEQSKKMANLKHKEQLEKSKNAQLMEDAKKREDNLNESSQQIKVCGEGGEEGRTGRYRRG